MRRSVQIISSSNRLSQGERKDLGAFYTPPELTDFACAWALRHTRDTVLDPGCGDAAFLLSAVQRLRTLGASDQRLRGQIRGIDLNPEAIATARLVLQQADVAEPALLQENFFTLTANSGDPALRLADAVVGNPPYVRYQLFRDDNRTTALKAAARAGVILPQLTSSWAPYAVHAISFLRPGGRMALVLPGELLHVGYAAAVREYLLKNFTDLTLISFEEKVFPGALEEVVLVLGIKAPGDGRLRALRLHSLQDLAGRPDDLLASSRICDLKPGQRWLTSLLEEDAIAGALDVMEHAHFRPLGELGRVDIGVVTGANDFFVLNRAKIEKYKLPDTVLLPAIAKAAHIQGTCFTHADWCALDARGEAVHLLLVDEQYATGSVASYLSLGEEQKLHERYKCRTRQPWYRVPYVRTPDLFLTYMSHISPRLVVNEARATQTNTLHGIFLVDKLLAAPLAAAFLNSATLLSAEIEGRSYGGGVLKMEPGEVVNLLVPKFTQKLVEGLREALPKVDRLVRDGQVDEASAVIDRLVLGKNFRQAEIEKIRSVLHSLRARRMIRGKTS